MRRLRWYLGALLAGIGHAASAAIITSGDSSPVLASASNVNATAGVTVGVGGVGTLDVDGGLILDIESDNSDNLNVASGTSSSGTVTVSGPGSNIITRGTSNTVRIGNRGTGSVTISDRASLRTLNLEIAQEGAGALTVTGVGSTAVVSNDNGSALFPMFGGFARVATKSGSVGTLTVNNGALLEVRTSADESEPELQIARDAGSRGTVVVTGASSRIDIFQMRALDPLNNVFGPLLRVGRGGDGRLSVEDGATVDVSEDGNVLVASSAGGVGSVNLTGNGSQLGAGRLLLIGKAFDRGTNSVLDQNVAPGGTGRVSVGSNASVSATRVEIGNQGSLLGNGVITGEVFNDGGTLGGLRVTGAMRQTAAGKLRLEITSEVTFQRLVVTGGDVDLAGTLELIFRGGFAPVADDSFELIDVTPGFRLDTEQLTITSAGLDPGAQFASDFNAASGRFTVTVLNDTTSTPPFLVSAVLPSSRSVTVGDTATAFATIINAGTQEATGCTIAPATTVAADFIFQTADAANRLVGDPNSPITIEGGAAQQYLFAFTPNAAFAPIDLHLSFDCDNSAPAAVDTGLNTLLLSASDTAVPDVIALAATISGDGIVNLGPASGAGAFSVATINLGSAGSMTVSGDTGNAGLPLSIAICQTDPATALCLPGTAPTAAPLPVTIGADATPTFSVFVAAPSPIAFDPAVNRVFVRFEDGGGIVRGATSVAVRTF